MFTVVYFSFVEFSQSVSTASIVLAFSDAFFIRFRFHSACYVFCNVAYFIRGNLIYFAVSPNKIIDRRRRQLTNHVFSVSYLHLRVAERKRKSLHARKRKILGNSVLWRLHFSTRFTCSKSSSATASDTRSRIESAKRRVSDAHRARWQKVSALRWNRKRVDARSRAEKQRIDVARLDRRADARARLYACGDGERRFARIKLCCRKLALAAIQTRVGKRYVLRHFRFFFFVVAVEKRRKKISEKMSSTAERTNPSDDKNGLRNVVDQRIYVDGGCKNNNIRDVSKRCAGYGIFVDLRVVSLPSRTEPIVDGSNPNSLPLPTQDDVDREILQPVSFVSEKLPVNAQYPLSNNRAEILAVVRALELLFGNRFRIARGTSVTIVNDSKYTYDIVTDWLPNRWRANNFKRTDGGDVLNIDLVRRLDELLLRLEREKPFDVRWQRLNSHQKEPGDKSSQEWRDWFGNDRADKLADLACGINKFSSSSSSTAATSSSSASTAATTASVSTKTTAKKRKKENFVWETSKKPK